MDCFADHQKTKIIAVVCFVLLFGALDALAFSPYIQGSELDGNWRLTFNDEFDAESLDSSKWNKQLPNGMSTIGESESRFLAENVSVQNGSLRLVSKKKGWKSSSAYIDSFGKFTQRYGYFEVRMKMPQAKGLHPAFWLMPDRGLDFSPRVHLRRSTSAGCLCAKDKISEICCENSTLNAGQGMEIDIVEYFSRPNKFVYASHWDAYSKDMKTFDGEYRMSLQGPKPLKSKVALKRVDDYMIFGLLWKAGLLVWYANGLEVARQESPRVADVPMHLVLSTEMGGNAGRVDGGALPDYTLVDYVRVWAW